MKTGRGFNQFVKNLKNKRWYHGSVWEFEWYITEFFVKASAYGNKPVALNLSMPVVGDEFLQDANANKIIQSYKQRFQKNKWLKTLIKRQNIILEESIKLTENIKNINDIDPKKYQEIQIKLSLLMSSVSGVFDLLISESVSNIASKNGIVEHHLVDYIISNSNQTVLSESNDKLISLFTRHRNQIEKSGYCLSNLDADLKLELKNHSENYGWINTGERGKKAWTSSDFLKQMEKLSETKKKKVNKFKIPQKHLKRIKLYIQINQNDNLAADYQVGLCFLFKKYLKRVLKEHYMENVLDKLTFNEIVDVSKNPKKILKYKKQRQKNYRIVWPGKTQLYFHYFKNKSSFKNIVKLIPHKNVNSKIKGTIACKGMTEGRVRIIKKMSDLKQFKKGEIMVAEKTQPSYVIYMTKAVAIITDIGGVTSHAAIISREFDIPSIVGTTNATRLLKNGDVVTVDANKGIVTKLEKPKQ